MKRFTLYPKGLLAFALCLSLSACVYTEDRISGPKLVRVNEIELMRSGGKLYRISDSGVVDENPAFFFRSRPDNTIQLWSWKKKDKKWEEAMAITSFGVPSEEYFIGRYKEGNRYNNFAYRFINDTHVQVVTAREHKPTTGLTYPLLVRIFDDLIEGKPHVFDGRKYEPMKRTYLIKFESKTSQGGASPNSSQGDSSASSTKRFDETRLRVGDTRYLTGALQDVLVHVLEVSPNGRRVRIQRSDDGSTEWVDSNRLISRDESTGRNIGRAVIGIGLVVCLLSPEACSQ